MMKGAGSMSGKDCGARGWARVLLAAVVVVLVTADLAMINPAVLGNRTGVALARSKETSNPLVIRVGHFPNITHAQALVGFADGTFAKALGPGVKIDRKVFNAGPSEIEAMLAGEIDLGYIGPVPAINGFVRSRGGLKIVAGATNGGAVLVARNGSGIRDLKGLAGKTVAVPQFGNTQDISLRRLLQVAGLKTANKGGNVTVLQVENPDIYMLFLRKEIDAALVPEPWGSRLTKEAGGRILLDWKEIWRDGNYSTAVIIVRTQFLEEHPDLVEKWLRAHVELTGRIAADPAKHESTLNSQIQKLTGKSLPPDLVTSALSRIVSTYDPVSDSIREFVSLSQANGYLPEKPDLARLLELKILNGILREKGLAPVR
ncbi:MAG: ABC transporter substrate-binding protein [Syntrophothermus sp.]